MKKSLSILLVLAFLLSIPFSGIQLTAGAVTANAMSTLINNFDDASGNAPFRTANGTTYRLTTSTDSTLNSKVVTFQNNTSGTNADSKGEFVGFHTGITGTPTVYTLPSPNKAGGELGFTLKVKGTSNFSSVLIITNGTLNYSAAINVTTLWQTIYIPFSSIQKYVSNTLSATNNLQTDTFGTGFFMRVIVGSTYSSSLYSGYVAPPVGSILSMDDLGYYSELTIPDAPSNSVISKGIDDMEGLVGWRTGNKTPNVLLSTVSDIGGNGKSASNAMKFAYATDTAFVGYHTSIETLGGKGTLSDCTAEDTGFVFWAKGSSKVSVKLILSKFDEQAQATYNYIKVLTLETVWVKYYVPFSEFMKETSSVSPGTLSPTVSLATAGGPNGAFMRVNLSSLTYGVSGFVAPNSSSIFYLDDVSYYRIAHAPTITGVSNSATYDLKDGNVSAHFNYGTATLNGNAYTSGTALDVGTYSLVVTDNGFTTTISFTVVDTSVAIDFSSFTVSQSNAITKVAPGTSVSAMKGVLKPKAGVVTVEFTNSSGLPIDGDNNVGTGTTMAVTQNSIVTNYTIVICGDLTGDGAISLDDLVAIKTHLLKSPSITNSSFLAAGDIFKKGNISISDLIAIKKNLLGLAVITQ